MFVDLVKIEVQSGNGGPGCVSFRREKFVAKGGPNGGDGGNGGSVYIQVDTNLNTLMDLKYRKKYKAKNGMPGSGSNKTGENGADEIVRVPAGTMVFDLESGDLLCDLVEDGERYLAAKGGKGGRGNTRFKSPTNQSPRRADSGIPGENKKLRLELKLIADVGLVGYPNAGKSSLLKALSKANPKIADYPFTTLNPNIGVVEVSEYKVIKMADIPGIISGASKGKGLGLQFLRHIERTGILLYLLDGDKDEFINDLGILQKELEEYNWRLLSKPSIVCVNKIDLWDKDNIREWKDKAGQEMLFISAKEKINLDELKLRLLSLQKENEEKNEKDA